MKKEYTNYKDWLKDCESLGWMHTHDEFIVVDDPDTDICMAEWDSKQNIGWILQLY